MTGKGREEDRVFNEINEVVVAQSPGRVCSSRPHGLQHSRFPYSSPSPRVCTISGPLNWWCHPVISSSVTPFSSCLQSYQHHGLSLESCGQSTGASASGSVLPMNIQGWFPLGLTGMISLLAKDYYFKYWNKRRGKTLFCTFWEYQGGKTGLWDMHTEKSRMNSPFTEECTQWHRSPFGEPWLWEPMENEAEGPPRWQKTTWCMMTLLSTPLSSSTKLPKSGGACAQSWQQAQVHRREGRPGICRSLGEKCGLQQAIMLSKPISEMQWGPQVRSEFSWEQFENKNHVKVISVGDMLSS